jgi:hypothetical protein
MSAIPLSTSSATPTIGMTVWKIVQGILLVLLVILLVIVGAIIFLTNTSLSPANPAPIMSDRTQFDGRYLLVASDADMVGTAYANGVLMQIENEQDVLSFLELPLTDGTQPVIEVPASNAVTSWPQITAVYQNTVYVVEASQPVDNSMVSLPNIDAFPAGRLVTRIDISNGINNPEITTVGVGEGAIHLGISADGEYLAVGMDAPGEVVIIPTATFTDSSTFLTLPINRTDGTPAQEISTTFWHPSGDFLAIGIDRRQLQFFRVLRDADGIIGIETHGAPLSLGNTITYGQFTNDGRFFLTAEINWEAFPRPLGNVFNPRGEMISIGFDETSSASHAVVSRVAVGNSPEGFAIDPQESLIVTVNMRRTYLPDNLTFFPGAFLNSLTLLTFNNQSGELVVVGEEYGFEGVLPEDAMFDADGDSLGVVIYNERENPMADGYVEFWNVIRGDAPRLERTSVRVPTVRGGHAMNLMP